ncbi:hypothetical protein [Thermococcus sp.]
MILMGSSSELLSGEMVTYLTGRYVRLTLFPFHLGSFSGSRM